MFKTILENFTVKISDTSYSAKAPISLFSLLTENRAIENPYYRDEACGRLAALEEPFEISVSFMLSSDAAGLKFAYLNVPDLDFAATLVFNEENEFSLSEGRHHRLNVSGLARKGENTVVIKFPPSSDARDVTVFERLEFLAFSKANIADVSAKPLFVSERVGVEISLDLMGDTEDLKAVATLISPSGQIYYGGITNGKTIISIPDPLLWWPGRYGVHNLYSLRINLYYENEVIDSKETKIGLRSVFLDEREGMGLTVNGIEFFAMGAEYRMDGVTPAFLAQSSASTLIPKVAAANMNFIRFRGEGRYPCNKFLDLCDTHGIAVELVLKSKKLERGDVSAFKRELVYNLLRLCAHPSVVCIAYERSDLSSQYEQMLLEAKRLTSTDITVREIGEGEEFLLPPSLPDPKTLRSVLEEEDMNVFSYVMECHMTSAEICGQMLADGGKYYKYANGMNELTYMSGILQAHAAERYVEELRLSRGRVGAAVISRLNDSAPSISSATVDFGARPKPAQYLAQRFFAPVSVFVKELDSEVRIVLSNESRKSFSGILKYSIRDAKNKIIHKEELGVVADKYSAREVCVVDCADIIAGKEREVYLEYSLVSDGVTVCSSSHLFVPPKHFRFKEPVVLSEITGSECEFRLTFSADVFVKDLVFSFDDIDAVFEENCIDLTDSSARRIAFVTSTPTTAEKLMSSLQLKSVYDIGKI